MMKSLCLFFILISSAQAYLLVQVKAVSSSKTTFVTRQGKKDGIIEGQKGTFTADNVSLVARAVTVTREFTQWESITENLAIPFDIGQVVTYNDSTDYIWTLTPETTRAKYLKKYAYNPRNAVQLRTGFGRGLSSSVSNASASSEKSRGSLMFEALYDTSLSRRWSAAMGMRYERELINVQGGQLETYRAMLTAEIVYQFATLEDFYNARPFINLGFGYGLSGTQTSGFSQRGNVSMLPSLKVGMSFPILSDIDLIIDGGLESLASREVNDTDPETETNQLNSRLAFGLRKYFE